MTSASAPPGPLSAASATDQQATSPAVTVSKTLINIMRMHNMNFHFIGHNPIYVTDEILQNHPNKKNLQTTDSEELSVFFKKLCGQCDDKKGYGETNIKRSSCHMF